MVEEEKKEERDGETLFTKICFASRRTFDWIERGIGKVYKIFTELKSSV